MPFVSSQDTVTPGRRKTIISTNLLQLFRNQQKKRLRMAVILKQLCPMVLAALILVASIQTADAATRGIRGRQQEQLDSLAVSENDSIERNLKRRRKKNKIMGSISSAAAGSQVSGRFDFIPTVTAPTAPPKTSPSLTDWMDGCSGASMDISACASNNDMICKQCVYALAKTSATPSNAYGGLNACFRNYCEMCTVDVLTPFFLCGYEMNDEFEISIPDPSIRTPPPIPDGVVVGRVDIPADTPAASIPAASIPGISAASTPSSLNAWYEGCTNESMDVNACASSDEVVCKQCLYSLSLTSVTLNTAFNGVSACAREFCGTCTNEKIMPFFQCGYKVSNGIVDSVIPEPPIETSPPANVTDATLVAPVIDEAVVDIVNCPAVYPQNETCVIENRFQYKKCRYYEVGMDVKCECSREQPMWKCTGTVTNEAYMDKPENSEVASSNETEANEFIQPLPSTDILVSRVGGL